MKATLTIQSKILIILGFLLPCTQAAIHAQNLPVHTIQENIVGAWTRVVDFNKDSIPDVLVQDGDTIWWYENNRPGWTRHLVDSLFKKSGFATLDVVDIDQDGDLDVFQAPADSAVVIAWNENRNNGTEWVRHVITDEIDLAGNMENSFGDLDGDGDLDIVLPSTGDFFIYWIEQISADNWKLHKIDQLDGVYWSGVIDLNGDGKLDVAVGEFFNGNVSWYENNLPDTSWLSHPIDSMFGGGYAITKDMDGDGDLDLLQAGFPDVIVYYENPSLKKVVVAENLPGVTTLAVADVDGDSDLDVTFGGVGFGIVGDLGWVENLGGGTSWKVHFIAESTDLQRVITGVADIDGDGDQDFLGYNFNTNTLIGNAQWYESSVFYYIDQFTEDFEPDSTKSAYWGLQSYWELGKAENLNSENLYFPEHTTFAGINDDGLGEDAPPVNSKIISPPIIRTQNRNYLLELDAFFINGDEFGDETAKVQYSKDRINWLTIKDLDGNFFANWQHIIASIPKPETTDTIYIALAYDDGGAWAWGLGVDNFNFYPAPDYLVQGQIKRTSAYTKVTPQQLSPFTWEYAFTNYGNLSLTDVMVQNTIAQGSSYQQFNQTIELIPSGETSTMSFEFLPSSVGQYSFSFAASNEQLGGNFFQTSPEFFEVNDSILAKDDGTQESQLGFGFGNPDWYGYYGSDFDLITPDTLTAITIYISRFSLLNGSSINLTVTNFDSTGTPDEELFHSEKIVLADYGINSSNLILTYQLQAPIVLNAGKYIFAAGQDTLQGIVGFDFDLTNTVQDGFWLTSPVAGGGYPWAHATNRETLMIRPHFKTSTVTTATHTIVQNPEVEIYPNPVSDDLTIQFKDFPASNPKMYLTDAAGKLIQMIQLLGNSAHYSMKNLTSGIYFLNLPQGKRMFTWKVVKQ